MKFQIKNRYSGAVQFECELEARYETEPHSVQLGAAVKLGFSSAADLREADLREADLREADLREANLREANLREANLRGADLGRADLSWAYLRWADLRGADLGEVPKIENIHQAIYAAASKPGALDMCHWHKCKTTHCRAGWVVTLAGEDGAALEDKIGTPAAAALIYQASDPGLERVPNFYASNSEALEDMQRLAEP